MRSLKAALKAKNTAVQSVHALSPPKIAAHAVIRKGSRREGTGVRGASAAAERGTQRNACGG